MPSGSSLTLDAGAQIGLPPSNDDDDGILTPEFMNFLTDSGRLEGNNWIGFWKEYEYAAFMSGRRRKVQYDSMVHYDSLQHYLRFYKSQGEYINGKKEGEWKTFVCYKKQLPLRWAHESKVKYFANLRQGWEEVFNKQGIFSGKNYYKDDFRDSTSVFYFSKGLISSTARYKKGKPHGRTVVYKPNGEVQFEMTFKNGERTGAIIYPQYGGEPSIIGQHETFYENGKLKSTNNYSHGELDGAHKNVLSEWKYRKEMSFKNGAIDGSYKVYYDNGQVKQESLYKEGKLWEVIQFNTRKGKSVLPGTLKDGSGSLLTYNDNGKLISRINYKNGTQERSDADH